MHAVLIDAYDSFVYIIDQYLQSLGATVRVFRNDSTELPHAVGAGNRPDIVVLGPGPGHPADSGYIPLINDLDPEIPVFGVCLGHQAIAMASGGRVIRAQRPRHGKVSVLDHDGRGCFQNLLQNLEVTRYHSLVVCERTVPDDIEVTARAQDDGHVMGIRSRCRPMEAVQFHPESIATRAGRDMLVNFIATYVGTDNSTYAGV